MMERSMTFADNLKTLPAIDGIARIELVSMGGQLAGAIENQPGK